jgi:alanyl-tRNA synthetase
MMRRPYPELAETVDRVASVIKREEESFLATIDGGLDRIEKLFTAIDHSGTGLVDGSEAAELYTTYGFPPELLETLAAERNCSFDWNGFRAAMDAHGQRSGAGSRVEVFTSGPLDALKKSMHGSEFVGYDTLDTDGKVIGIIAQGQLCDSLREVGHASPITIVLDRTSFYGESGGQVGDIGSLVWQGGRFEVSDTQREGGFMLHTGHLREGWLDLGQTVQTQVDANRRTAIRRACRA